MKPRKPTETDADYIKRLEHAYAEKAKTNERWKKDWKRMMHVLLPAASKAGQVLDAAAEVCGVKDDPEIAACKAGLSALAACVWHDDNIEIPELPKWPRPDGEKFGGDAEMILLSAIERVKQYRAPWEDWRDVVPRLKATPASDLNWEDLAHQVYDALCDLEASRGLLRLDLRSTMYDHCFERIRSALYEAETRQRDEQKRDQDWGLPVEDHPF